MSDWKLRMTDWAEALVDTARSLPAFADGGALDMTVLLMPETGIDLAPLEQFLMRSHVRDLAALQDENGVGIDQGRQAVGNHDHRASMGDPSMLALTIASLSGSSALVASSRIRIRGSTMRARAIARRWRWPPDRLGDPS